MSSNIVIFEMNPEYLMPFRVSESVMPAEELAILNGIAFNCDDASDLQWALWDKLNTAIGNNDDDDGGTVAPGVEKLEFPFAPLPGEFVYHVFFAM